MQNWSAVLCRKNSSSIKDVSTAANSNGVGNKTTRNLDTIWTCPFMKCCWDEWYRWHQVASKATLPHPFRCKVPEFYPLQGHLGNPVSPAIFNHNLSILGPLRKKHTNKFLSSLTQLYRRRKKRRSLFLLSFFLLLIMCGYKSIKRKRDIIIAEVFLPTKAPCPWGHP